MLKNLVLIFLIVNVCCKKKPSPEKKLIALENKLSQVKALHETEITSLQDQIITLMKKHNLTRASMALATNNNQSESQQTQQKGVASQQTSFFSMIADLLWVLTAFIAVGLILKVMVYPLGQVLVLLWALSELSEDWYEHKPWKKNALILFGTSLLHQLFKTILDSIIQESKKGSNIKQKAANHPMDYGKTQRIDPEIVKKSM